MFWKLWKFELKSSYRMYFLFYAVLLISSVFMGIGAMPSLQVPALLEFFLNLGAVVYVAAIIAVNILTYVFIFRGYVQSMYKRQAYLTHTLPVSTWKTQLVKLLSAFLWLILTLLVSVASIWLTMSFTEMNTLGALIDEAVQLWQDFPYKKEMLISCVLGIMELIELISLIYFVINAVHSAYVQRYRVIIAIVMLIIISYVQSFAVTVITDLLQGTALSEFGIMVIFCVGAALMIGLWNIGSIYILDHKMEVE